MRNSIEAPADLQEFTSFSADVDLTASATSPCASPRGATVIDVIDGGSGKLSVRMEGEPDTVRDLTVATGDQLIGFFRVIVANAAAKLTGDAETYVLTDGMTLTLSVDGAADDTATFNTGDFSDIGAATAAEVASVINADITGVTASDASGSIQILSDTAGTGGSLRVTGGTALAALGFALDEYSAGGDTDVTRVRVGWPSR